MDDNKRKLYNALSQDYDLGTYEQFESDIADAGKRRKLYDATIEEYDFGDFSAFENQLGFGGEAQVAGLTPEPNETQPLDVRGDKKGYTFTAEELEIEEPKGEKYTDGNVIKPAEYIEKLKAMAAERAAGDSQSKEIADAAEEEDEKPGVSDAFTADLSTNVPESKKDAVFAKADEVGKKFQRFNINKNKFDENYIGTENHDDWLIRDGNLRRLKQENRVIDKLLNQGDITAEEAEAAKVENFAEYEKSKKAAAAEAKRREELGFWGRLGEDLTEIPDALVEAVTTPVYNILGAVGSGVELLTGYEGIREAAETGLQSMRDSRASGSSIIQDSWDELRYKDDGTYNALGALAQGIENTAATWTAPVYKGLEAVGADEIAEAGLQGVENIQQRNVRVGDSTLNQIMSGVGSMVADLPFFGMFGKVASFGSRAVGRKVVEGAIKREAAKQVAKGATEEAAKRYATYAVQEGLKNRLMTTLTTSAVQSGLTFGLFDVAKEAAHSTLTGDWDAGKLAKSFVGGTLMGTALGGTNATGSYLTRNLTGAKKAAGKVAEFAAENTVFTEGGRLISEWKGEEPSQNSWLEDYLVSGATLGVIKLPGVIKNIRGIKANEEAKSVYSFTEKERELLTKNGEELTAVLEEMLPKGEKMTVEGEKVSLDGVNEGVLTEQYVAAMNNPEIPLVTKAKLMAVVEGKVMPAPRVTTVNIEGNAVKTYDPMGRLVETKEFKTTEEAKAEYKKATQVAEIEGISFLEDMYVRIKGYEADDVTVKEWLAKNPDVKAEDIANIIAKDNIGEPLTKAEQKILDSLRESRREGLNDVAHLNEVLAGLEQKGIDAKDVITGIEKPASERTEAENKAVNAYREVLMNEVEYIFKAKKLVTEAEMREQRIRTAEDVERAADRVKRQQKALADRIYESDRSVDETANNGMVYTTTAPSGEKIIITGGKVVLDNEGYIDVNQSEGLVALMPDGTKKSVRVDELREKVEVSNAEELKAAKREEIRQEVAAENGWIELVPGNEYEVVLGGEPRMVKVEGRDERGDVVISMNGEAHPIAERFLQIAIKEAEALRNGEAKDENQIEVAPVVEGQKGEKEQPGVSNELSNEAQQPQVVAPVEENAPVEVKAVKGENVVESSPTGEAVAPVVETPKTALEQIPRNEKNVPLYEQVDSELAWDGVVEEAGGNEETAMIAVNSMIADKQDALKKAEKAKARSGATITEKIAAENERVTNIEKAKADLAKWEEIAGVKAKRALAAEAESKRVADEAAARQRAEEERLRAEREAAERAEREALNGVPDMVDDKPQDARARGYRRVNGHKVDRQEPVQGLMGKEIAVKFSDSSIPTGRVAVIEAEQLQPSHIQGQRNPLHFIDEAQPKERNDAASVLSARKIAENVRPEEITSSVTAYTGAPTVNARGEAVQGNNRSAALRLMWENNPEQAAKYKQYLMDHAAEFGLNAEDVAAMKSPVLVNMLDVSDADAITLGQYVAQDTESGGTERIKPKNVMQKMGGDMRSFANKLLASNNEEASFAELVDANGVEVLKWMAQKGYITPTQYKSAFDSNGNLTAEVKNDLRDVMYQSIFKGGSTQLEEMFNALPAKAQKAILATAFRDYDSPNAERMNGEVQNSIRAYYALARDAAFANAKNYKEAKEAAMMWARQYQLDDVSGESFLPSENFSNFAIELAVKFKGETQKTLQNLFNNIYDLIQGTKQTSLFEEADNTPRTLKEAIKETFNIDYNGQYDSNSLAGGNKAGQPGRQGTAGSVATGERIEGGERPADSTGGARGNGEVSSSEIPNNQNRDNVSQVEGAAEGEVKTESGEVKTENAPSEADAPGQSGVAATLIKGAKWENTGEPDKIKSSRKKGDSHDITWYIGKKKYGSTTAERDLLVVLAEDYRGDLNAVWNAYEQGEVLLSANEAAILKKLIETNTSAAELQQGVLELDRENPAFERATENVRKKLEATGVKVKVLTKEEAEKALAELEELADMQKRKSLETALPEDESSFKGTVISSDNGTKVLKDLDSAIERYENKGNSTKTFIGEVGRILRAVRFGSKSEYADFVTANGIPVRIRLADHNAKISNFDHHDVDNGISIVISRAENTGIVNDGNAHLVEFFYSDKKLKSADGKPLVEILKSIKQALYSGEYKDNTGLAQPEEVNIPEFMKVFHGSGAKFDRFDHSHMGEGEGVQAYGWGTYVTEVEGIGKQYAKATSKPSFTYKGQEVDVEGFENPWRIIQDLYNEHRGKLRDMRKAADYYSDLAVFNDAKTKDLWQNVVNTLADIRAGDLKMTPSRVLYTVEIPDDNGSNYLYWDERVPMNVVNSIKKRLFDVLAEGDYKGAEKELKSELDDVFKAENNDGYNLYGNISAYLGGAKEASQFLNDMGFVGISYPAEATTGGRKDKARNYVIFNENDAQIEGRVEFLRTSDGTTYGWAVNGTIYLMPEGLNPNTPIHEYTHLWAAALQKSNPKLWSEVVEAMKLSPAWNEVMADENYTDIHGDDNRVASEVLSRLSGNEGYRRYMEQAEAEIAAERNIGEKVRKKGILNRIKNAVSRFWNWLKGKLGSKAKAGDSTEAKTEPWDVFINKTLKDFDEGVNPDAKDSPLDRMFMGKKGAANLDKADEATTRLDNLNVAREMETGGKDAKAIKLATGWERGADGKWRYETEDAKVNRAAKLYNLETRESYPIAKSIEIGRVDDNSTIRLTDLVKDDELFKAYPEMEEYFVSFEKMDAGTEGSHSFEEKMIRINKDDIHSLESTLVHEIQHAVQSIEGFAKGGSTSSSNGLIQEVLKTLHVDSENAAPSLSEVIGAIENGYITRSQHEELVKIAQSHGYDDAVEYVRSLSPYSYYRRLAGEVESRNVEERLGMSPEERRNKLAEETEDVRRKDQIFILDNLGVSASQEVAPGQDIPLDEVKSQPLTSFKDLVTNKVLETSAKNKEDYELRASALQTYGRNLEALVKRAMGKQKRYDKATVNELVKLAKMYFKHAQLLGEVSPYQVGGMMSALNDAVGKEDITDNANKLIGILVDAHNKALDDMLEKASKTKAKKVNASGVEVIGKLDKEGQIVLEEYNNSKVLDLETIEDKISVLEDEAAEASGKLEGENGEVERETAAKIRGLEMAKRFREDILQRQQDIKGMRDELRKAEKEMSKEAFDEFRRATERTIVETKLEMVDAYHDLIHAMSGDISISAKRAKIFQQAQIDHVKEIQHNANSDLQGHPAETQGDTPDKWNSAVPRIFMSAMPTFQTMLKFFGEKAADGRGYLYERFMPQVTQASHNEFVGKMEAREKMRDKLTEIFGKKTSIEDFMGMSRKDGAVVEYQEGGEKKTINLTKGQVLYLYMVNKMADGQMKLSRMGITDADVQKMANELPEEFVRFADWVQEDLLTELRGKYNAVHERMFGAPMAEIENYFPIKINKRSRGEKVEPGMNTEDRPSTITGSVIKRTKNSIAVDLSADAMQVLLGHIDDMENWAAYAEVRRDVKSLLNYRHFQNQVKGMKSLRFGSGEKLWNNFVDVANIAVGSYKPSNNPRDKAVRNIAKGVVSSKIAFRYFTALKQILSLPAFWSEADVDNLMFSYMNQKGSWDWAMDNLPGFSKRWKGRAAGNEILLESDKDWKVWKNRMVEWLSKKGMRANAFIDALTVATGARAVYMTKYDMFKKAGYSEERAKEKALQRAAEAYNESQQSSEGAYLSPLQAEATVLSSILTAYRNSPFGYNRKVATAIANLRKKMKKGFKQESIDFMTKQLMRDGMNEEQAKRFAKSTYRRSVARDAADFALYEFFLNGIWALGPALIYILGGDDEEKKIELLKGAALDGVMGGVESLPAGEMLSGVIEATMTGDYSQVGVPQLVATQDLENIADLMEYDPVRAANEVLNILVSTGTGVNPQTFTDLFVALSDVEDFTDPRELAMFAARAINAPNSQLEQLDVDKAMEEYGKNAEEVVRRYAEYRKKKLTPLTGWRYSDEDEQKAMERYEKRFKRYLDERLEAVVENTSEYENFYNNADPLMRAKLSKLRKAYLEGDKKVTFEKLEAEELVKKTLYGAGYDDINTVYFELSNAQDEDMELMIDEKLKELKPVYEEHKTKGKEFYELHKREIDLYGELVGWKNAANGSKRAMKDDPERAQGYMNEIREYRTKAIDLINNYNE